MDSKERLSIIKKGIGVGISWAADLGAGLIIVHFLMKTMSLSRPYYFATFLAIAPDIDGIIQAVLNQQVDESHRTWAHYPIIACAIFVILGFLSLIWPILWFWAIAELSLLLFHYLHDSVGRDVVLGEKWLWPARRNIFYKFFANKYGKRHLLVSFTAEEVDVSKSDAYELESWLRNYYLKLTPELVIGLFILIVAVAIVLIDTFLI